METALIIASKRDLRRYEQRAPTDLQVARILRAGRAAGSSKNRQSRRFIILDTCRARAARAMTRPANVRSATLAVAIVAKGSRMAEFDVGRAAQNMMLAAWEMGIASCPNAVADPRALRTLLSLGDDERVAIIISFGFPATPIDSRSKSADAWFDAADRVPLAQLVECR